MTPDQGEREVKIFVSTGVASTELPTLFQVIVDGREKGLDSVFDNLRSAFADCAGRRDLGRWVLGLFRPLKLWFVTSLTRTLP
jgi:hypothetical protein